MCETPLEMTSGGNPYDLFCASGFIRAANPPVIPSEYASPARTEESFTFILQRVASSNSERFLDYVSHVRNSARNDKRGATLTIYFARLALFAQRILLSFRANARPARTEESLTFILRRVASSNSKRFLDYVSHVRNSARNDKRGRQRLQFMWRVWLYSRSESSCHSERIMPVRLGPRNLSLSSCDAFPRLTVRDFSTTFRMCETPLEMTSGGQRLQFMWRVWLYSRSEPSCHSERIMPVRLGPRNLSMLLVLRHER
jgi:hypothetical protein